MGNKTSTAQTVHEAGCFSGLFDHDSPRAPSPPPPTEAVQPTPVDRRRRRGNAAPTQLHNRSTAAMFESSQNTQIHGGTFTAQHGPHATFTVNINNGPRAPAGSRNISYQASNQEQQRIITLANRPLPDIPPEEHSRNSLARYSAADIDQQRPFPTSTGLVQKSNELYEKHLLQKKRGHPLWMPQSNMRLPTSYRVKGVSIGDVGIITPDGSFDFLFNICLSATDPINYGVLPEGFVPLDPPLSQRDIREFREFTNGSYLASSSVSKVHHSHTESRVLEFESSASEGAVLTLPEGAYKEDINNISKFHAHVAAHAESWYEFVNGPCGREAQNGDLRLVVGCDKTTYWGMATFHNIFQKTNFRLNYVARNNENGQRLAGEMYSWEHSGAAEVRVGPELGENDELVTETNPPPLRNQCLFLRTLTVTISYVLWQGLRRRLALDVSPSHPLPPTSAPGTSQTSEQSLVKPDGAGSYSNRGAQGSQYNQRQIISGAKLDVIIHHSLPSTPVVHPAKLINDLLLKEKPEAKIAVTNDRDWYSVVSSDVSILSDPDRLKSKICETSNIYVSADGVAYFEPKEPDLFNLRPEMVKQVQRLKDGTIRVQEYLFGPSRSSVLPRRRRLLEALQSKLLEDFVVDNKMTLRQYIKAHPPSTPSSSIVDVLEDLQASISSGSLEVKLRSGGAIKRPDDKPHQAHLEGHPYRLLSLDQLIRSVRMDSERFDLETIPNLRARLSTYSASTVVECQVPYLLDLANALFGRYLENQQRDDLDEAIFYYEQASASLTLIASYRHVEALLGLCSSLHQRLLLNERFEDLVDLVKCLNSQADISEGDILLGESLSKAPENQSPWNGPYSRTWRSIKDLIIVQEEYQSIPSDLRQLMNVQSRAASLLHLSNVGNVDIKRYLVDCFRKIREAHPRRAAHSVGNWPQDERLDMLVKLSSNKFIFAMTAMRYVSSPHHIPADRLMAVLDNAMPGVGIRSLHSMIINDMKDLFEVIRLLGFFDMEMGFHSMKPRDLEEYLFLKKGDVQRLLIDLDPFIEFVDADTPFFFRHSSFSDLFLDPSSPTGRYMDSKAIHKESIQLCIRHLKQFYESGYKQADHLTSTLYSCNNIAQNLSHAEPHDEKLRSEVSDVPYVQCLLNWIPGMDRNIDRPDELFCQFMLALKNSRFSNKDELYIHHQRIWDEGLLDRLSGSPLDFGLTLCLTLVGVQWSVINPLDILKHISAISPSPNYQDIYPCGQFLYCLSVVHDWSSGWTPQDKYRQHLLDFLFDSMRSGPYYLDQAKFTTVGRALIDFMIRPWDDGKRSIRNPKTWQNILLALSQILKHIGYKKELMATLCQSELLFRLPFTQESGPEISKHIKKVITAIQEYVNRNGTGRSTDVLHVIVRDEFERTSAEFHGEKDFL